MRMSSDDYLPVLVKAIRYERLCSDSPDALLPLAEVA
jgi:hypothetical protein